MVELVPLLLRDISLNGCVKSIEQKDCLECFVHLFITICRAHYIDNVESEALEAVARWHLATASSASDSTLSMYAEVVSYWQSSEFLSCA